MSRGARGTPPARWTAAHATRSTQPALRDPSLPHNYVQTDLLGALRDWTLAATARGRVMLPLDVRLDERNVGLELGCADALTSPQLPGFAFPLAELFGD